jgi:ADP-ribose pyrophosphatase
MRRHGPWTILKSNLVYKDPWVEVRRDDVLRPDGAPGTHSVVHLKPGVSVLPLDNEGFVYLTEEFHYAVGRNTLEVVSGGVELDEDPLVTARRETEEELGIEAGELIALGMYDPFTTMITSPTALYLARDLRFVESRPDGTEQIRCVKLPFAEAFAMALDSRITHGPSCVLILRAAAYLRSAGALDRT